MADNLKFARWIEEWLLVRKAYIKESTFASYTNIVYGHILPRLGNFELAKMDSKTLQGFTLDLLQNGRQDGGGGLAVKTVRDTVMLVKNCLRAAMRERLIPLRDMGVSFPRSCQKARIQVLDQEQQRRLVQAIYLNLTPKSAGILICLYTGLRIGEICALKWSDIDLKNKVLRVSKTVQRIYTKSADGGGCTKVLLTTPKTRASNREVPLSGMLCPVLAKMQPRDNTGFVLSGMEKCVEVRTYRSFFNMFLRTHGIDPIHFHGLRHTFATRCIEAGGDCKTVSELLGHSTVNMTLNLYVHPQLEQKRHCIELLSNFL